MSYFSIQSKKWEIRFYIKQQQLQRRQLKNQTNITLWIKKKQKTAISLLTRQLNSHLKMTPHNKPLILITGEFNGAYVSTLCQAFKLHQVNKHLLEGRTY
jgi:hypothetical protein